MAGERKYTRIPPESTGDRVYMVHTAEITYKNKNTINDAHDWRIGEIYSIAGFGDVHVHGELSTGIGTGVLSVHYNESSRYDGSTPDANARIQYEGGDIAEVDSLYDVYVPAQNIMGYDNPEYGWNIDRFGSGSVTFDEGPPQITAMGNLKVNDAELIASYDFSRSNLPNEFVNSREGGSAVSNMYDASVRGVKLTVGTTAGDRVTQTSNLFHSFQNGATLLFILSARCGDEGKENNTRLWGAFDATDGFFFQVKGSDDSPGNRDIMGTPTAVTPGPGTALRVVHRYTFPTGGSVVDHSILQSEWNKDTLLGTGGASNPSGMNIDISKINSYWIDYQYVGGGRTRWGVFYNGERIVCHETYHGNGEEGTMTQNHHPIAIPSRPICFATANYGTAPSSSEFFAFGASAFVEAATDPLKSAQQVSIDIQTKFYGEPNKQPYWRTGQTRNGSPTHFPGLLKTGSLRHSDSTQYATTLSPMQFFPDGSGQENHSVYQPLSFQLNNHNISDDSGSVAEVRAFYNCKMRGLRFSNQIPSTPTVEYDVHGDHLAHQVEIGRFVVEGQSTFDFTKFSDNYQYGTVKNTSDQSLARELQPLSEWLSNNDIYSTGNGRVELTVGPDPTLGLTAHYFGDMQPIVIRESDGDQNIANAFSTATTFTNVKTAGGAGYASVDQVDNPNDWHYLSYISSNEAWLYGNTAAIDDDRLVRVLSVDDCVNLDLGDTLTITSTGATGYIMKIDVNGANIAASSTSNLVEYQIVKSGNSDFTAIGADDSFPGTIFTADGPGSGTGLVRATSGANGTIAIVGRSDADTQYYNGANLAFTTTGSGAGDVTAITTDDSLYCDYWTSIKALTYTDLGIDADEDLTPGDGNTGLAFFGSPQPRAAWTFMIKNLNRTSTIDTAGQPAVDYEDADGDSAPVKENARSNWNIFWRERSQ
jgi:hypothetical protein